MMFPCFHWKKMSFPIDLPFPRNSKSSTFGQRHRATGLLERGRRVSTWLERWEAGGVVGEKMEGKPWKIAVKWDMSEAFLIILAGKRSGKSRCFGREM